MRRWSTDDLPSAAVEFGPSGLSISVQNVFGPSRVRARDRDAEIRPEAWSTLRIVCFHACTVLLMLPAILSTYLIIGVLVIATIQFQRNDPRNHAIDFWAKRLRVGLLDMYWHIPRAVAHAAVKPRPTHVAGTFAELLPTLILLLPSLLALTFLGLPIFVVLEIDREVRGHQGKEETDGNPRHRPVWLTWIIGMAYLMGFLLWPVALPIMSAYSFCQRAHQTKEATKTIFKNKCRYAM
jgi:hypothetical protein